MALPEKQSQAGRPLSIRAFADLAGTNPRRIRRLIRQGRLRTVINQAGETRIPEKELERLEQEKLSRALRQSMEMQAVPTTEIEVEEESQALSGPIVPLQRHEAAMVRLGYLESELGTTRKLLQDSTTREVDLKKRAEEAEQDAISATVRAVEAEHNLEEMRAQVIDSTFRAMELEQEVGKLRERLMEPWWRRIFPGKPAKDD
ncbi:MAG: hypothetical protein KC910_04895 [Candidatus Eremiobacteraeota bacterium]|nr:hypothetical protein [Candidatus Eremiobacteraeota bacterium]